MTTHTASLRRPVVPLSAAATAEWLKLWTLPRQRVLIMVAIGLAALSSAFFYVTLPATQGRTLGELDPSSILGAGILGVDAATFVVIPLAAIFVGAEYSTGLIQTTLTLTPDRRRIVLGKLSTIGAVSLGIGAVAAVVCTLVAVIAGALIGSAPGEILTGAGIQLAAGSILMPLLYGVIAAAGAFVFRSTAGGILVPLTITAVGGVAGWLGEAVDTIVTPIMPASALHTLEGIATGHQMIGILAAVVSVLVWLGVAAAASAWRMLRHDA